MTPRNVALGLVATAALAGLVVASSPRPIGCGGALCCRRPSPDVECLRIDPNTLQPGDWGDAVMPSSHAVGAGCVPAACVEGGEVEWLDGGTP